MELVGPQLMKVEYQRISDLAIRLVPGDIVAQAIKKKRLIFCQRQTM